MRQKPLSIIYIGFREVRWIVVRTENGELQLTAQGVEPCDPAAGIEEACRQALPRVVAHLQGDVGIVLQAEKTWVHLATLPAATPAEILAMATLQAEKSAPFPADRMRIASEILYQGDASSQVLIAAARHDTLEAVAAACRQAGLKPAWIDLDIMGWWSYLDLRKAWNDAEGAIGLVLDQDRAMLLAVMTGAPRMVRCLGEGSLDAQATQAAEALTEELAYSLTLLEAEASASWEDRITIWCTGKPGEEDALVSRLRETCGIDTVNQPGIDKQAVCLGCARRHIQPTASPIDLSLPAWRAAQEKHRFLSRLLVAGTAFLVVWLVALLAFFGLLRREQTRIADLRSHVLALEEPASEVRAWARKKRALETYADRSHSVLEALRAIVVLLPETVMLTSFQYRKGGALNLRGTAPRPEAIYDFFQALEESRFFVSIEPGHVRDRTDRSGPVSEFNLTATLPGEEDAP